MIPPVPRSCAGARAAPFPDAPRPQLARAAERVPEGRDWIHEPKIDGYRILALVRDGKARLLTRSGLDWTDRLPGLAAALAGLPVREAIFDGEATVPGPSGFADLQAALAAGRDEPVVYFVFDLLHLNGYDLTDAALVNRKSLLAAILSKPGDRIRPVAHQAGEGPAFYDHACRRGLEGVVSKRADAPYRAGRGGEWLKIKCSPRDDFLIGGFTEPRGRRRGLGSLLLGSPSDEGLRYVGRVGTGFSDALLRELRVTLEALERATPPFVPPPRGPAHWTEPRLSAEVEFNGRTREGLLRQAAFVGLREDRAAGPLPLLSTPHRILYPDSGLTKLDLAAYYMEVSRWLLPYVEGRLLALVRCPEGQSKPCFFQKHALAGLPSAIRVRPTLEGEGRVSYLYIQDKAGLVGLAQLGVLEIHPWGSRVESIDKPDRCIFDLDPGPDVPAARVVEAARSIRDRLAGLGLLGFVKTTGGKGLHVVVPLSGPLTWKDVKGFSKAVASEMARRAPDRYTATLSKSARQGRIFIDYLRNRRGATAVAAYSPRALPGAPVSVPFAWEELSPDLVSHGPTIRTLGRRLSHLARDPWEGFATLRQSLPRSWSSELSIA